MKVVVTGATGNVGTSTVQALSESSEIDQIVGLARRKPTWTPPKTSWLEANVLNADLGAIFAGATGGGPQRRRDVPEKGRRGDQGRPQALSRM